MGCHHMYGFYVCGNGLVSVLNFVSSLSFSRIKEFHHLSHLFRVALIKTLHTPTSRFFISPFHYADILFLVPLILGPHVHPTALTIFLMNISHISFTSLTLPSSLPT